MLAVTLTGNYDLELDRAVLLNSGVTILFRGGVVFQGGVAVLQIGSSSPVTMDATRVPLPIARLAFSPRALGNLLTLDVQATRASASLTASFGLDRVLLTQRMR
jgi:hypothetical protein